MGSNELQFMYVENGQDGDKGFARLQNFKLSKGYLQKFLKRSGGNSGRSIKSHGSGGDRYSTFSHDKIVLSLFLHNCIVVSASKTFIFSNPNFMKD